MFKFSLQFDFPFTFADISTGEESFKSDNPSENKRRRLAGITGQPFAKTRDALKSKQKQLKWLGKGNKQKDAASFDQEEIDLLFRKGVMGIHSPQALINTLWFNNCLHFNIRGGKAHRNLRWGDVVFKTDCNGKGYLEYSAERQKRTRPGDNSQA